MVEDINRLQKELEDRRRGVDVTTSRTRVMEVYITELFVEKRGKQDAIRRAT